MINETWIRLGCFITVLVLMLLWESLKPSRHSAISTGQRWFSNFSMVLLGALVARVMLPTGLAAIGIYAQNNHLGLWNGISVSLWISVPITLILLDCFIYWQHRLFHRVPWLWRLHQVHHADPHLDASTGLRFHPFEIAISLAIKVLAILLLGAPLIAILIFEIVLNASSLFNHSNINLPTKLERLLRKVIVTQAMHRIHHSQNVRETDSNFSFNLSLWDRVFGSYTQDAQNGDSGIKLGLKQYSSIQSHTRLTSLLIMPFKNKS
ncbi:sterol desaturase family protein [Paraglaciecola aestuariivivens]